MRAPSPAFSASRLAGSVLIFAACSLPWLEAADEPRLPPGVVANLKGHSEPVYSVVFTPDGRHVVTGSFDNTLKIWDAATGKEIKTFGGPTGHQNLVLSVAVSPDGRLIASGSSDNTAKIWDFPTSTSLRSFALGEAGKTVAVSPDGTRVAAGSNAGVVKVWNAADGKELFQLKGHAGAVHGVAFSPNGQYLASCGADKTIRFWNPANGQAVAVYGAHSGEVNGLIFNAASNALFSGGADGTLKFWALPPVPGRTVSTHADTVATVALSGDNVQVVSAGADKTLRLTNFANGQQTRQVTAPAAITAAAVAGNGTFLAAGTADNRLLIWNNKDAAPISSVIAHGGTVTSVSFNPAGNQLLTGGADGLLKLWAVPTPTRTLTHPDAVNAAVLTADGKRLFTAGADKIVRAWNPADPTKPERQFTGHTEPVHAVAVSPDGKVLASAGADKVIRFWDPSTGQTTQTLGAHVAAVTSLSFHPNGQQLLSASADGTLKLWQVPPTALVKPFTHPEAVTSAVLSPDGTRLLTGCADKQVRLWNLATGQMERAFPGNAQAILAVAFSANGSQVAAGGADKSLTVWNAADAKEIKKFANLPAAVNAVAFSPDGKLVAAGLVDHTIRIFDLGMGKEIKQLKGHVGPVTALLFTPKGEQLVSASADKTVQTWNVADGTSKRRLDHGGAVQCLALSKDGTRLASGGANKRVKVWTLADGKQETELVTLAEVRGVGFSPDGKRLVVAEADNVVRVFGLDGVMQEFFSHEGPVVAAGFLPDGKRLFAASADKTARLWTPTLIWQTGHTKSPRQAVFSPKSDQIIAAYEDKTMKIWSAADGKLVKSFEAHNGPVVGVAVSADGTRLVSAGADKTVKIWSLAAKPGGKEADKPATTISLPETPEAVTVSPNGTRLAVAVGGKPAGQVKVFDAATGKELMSFTDHAGAVRLLAFQGDNRTLLSAGADKTARLTDINLLSVLDGHAGGVSSVAFNGAGNQALSGGADKTVKLWDLTTGKVTRTIGPLASPVNAVAFSRDFTQIGAAAGQSVQVWNATDGKELLSLAHPAEVVALSFSADKTKIATAATDNQTRVWDVATGKELQAFPHDGPVRSVVFHANNKDVISAAGKTVTVDAVTATRLIVVGAPVRELALTPNGSHVLAAVGNEGKLYNAANGAAENRSFAAGDKPTRALAVSKNGVLVAVGGDDLTVRVYQFADGKLLAAIKAPAPVSGLAFSPTNQTLVAACADKTVQTWNVLYNPGQPIPANFGKPIQSYAHEGAATAVAFAPDSATFYTASADKTVRAWKTPSEGPTKNFGHPNLVDAVAFNPAGTQLATGCHDGKLRIFDLAKGQAIKEINAHPTPMTTAIYCIAWSADGKQILTGGQDRSLKLWDAAAGTLVREFKPYSDKDLALPVLSGSVVGLLGTPAGHRSLLAASALIPGKPKKVQNGHRDSVFCLAFSPDGKTIASGGSDQAIKLWNVADGSVIREFVNPAFQSGPGPQAHPGYVYGVRFVGEGKYLVSAGGAPRGQGYLAVWNVADGNLLQGQELPIGTLYALAVSADGKYLALGTGSNLRTAGPDANSAYVLKMPEVIK
jgi:WD40 repeat protein